MDTAQHTPGPWKYCPQNGSPTTGQHMIAGGKPGYLAEVRDCGSGDVVANARLIAAAPELLVALEQALEQAIFPGVTISDAYNNARAAVAKATGSQP